MSCAWSHSEKYKTLNAWKESETETTVTIISESENGKRTRLVLPK
jgi:hypothetical protein